LYSATEKTVDTGIISLIFFVLGKVGKQNQSDEMNKLQAVTVIVFVVCGFFWLDVTSDWFRRGEYSKNNF